MTMPGITRAAPAMPSQSRHDDRERRRQHSDDQDETEYTVPRDGEKRGMEVIARVREWNAAHGR
jgi:hypothetical protein